MRYILTYPTNLKPGDKFSLMNSKFNKLTVQFVKRFRIAGLSICAIHIGKGLMPITLTKGTHVYKIRESKTVAA